MSHFSKTFQGEAISYVQSIYAIGLVDAIKRLCLYTTIGLFRTFRAKLKHIQNLTFFNRPQKPLL